MEAREGVPLGFLFVFVFVVVVIVVIAFIVVGSNR